MSPKPTQDSGALTARESELIDTVLTLEDRLAKLETGQAATTSTLQTDAEKLTASMDEEFAELAKEFKDYGAIQMLTRRVSNGTDASNDIRFKDEPSVMEDPSAAQRKWHPRWFNFAKDGRAFEAAAKGWEKVKISDLQDPEAVTGGVRIDEFARRGEKEVLMRMPEKLWKYMKKREQLGREGKLSSESWTQDYLANQVAAAAGNTGGNADQAGSFVASKGFHLDISEQQTGANQIETHGVVPA